MMSFKGYHHSEESKAKIGLASSGKIISEEHKAKISLANSGRVFSEEHKVKLSKAHLGKTLSENHKAKLSKAGKRQILSEEHKAALLRANLGKKRTNSIKAKLSRAKVKNWENPTYRNSQALAIRLALKIHPNKPEIIVMNILESICPSEFKFVGDGQLIIAGKNPDFANINGHKQLIELFGDYWHRGENPKDRKKLFKQYGFDTLVIWESELKTPWKVMNKVKRFRKLVTK